MISVRACAAFFRETRTRYSAPSVAAVGRLARRVGVGDDGRDRDGRAVNDNLAEHVHFRRLVSPVPPLPIYYALYIYIYIPFYSQWFSNPRRKRRRKNEYNCPYGLYALTIRVVYRDNPAPARRPTKLQYTYADPQRRFSINTLVIGCV